MSWHEGEGKAARIRVPPAVAYTKGRYTLWAGCQESAVRKSLPPLAARRTPGEGPPPKNVPPGHF